MRLLRNCELCVYCPFWSDLHKHSYTRFLGVLGQFRHTTLIILFMYNKLEYIFLIKIN